MSDRTKLLHLVVGLVACLCLAGLSFVSKRWGLDTGAQATIAAFLGLVLWNVRSVLFRSTPETPEEKVIVTPIADESPSTPKNDKPPTVPPLMMLTLLLLSACSPTAMAHEANVIESAGAGAEYAGCTVKVKAMDGGTMRDWHVCATEVDRAHNLDAGAR